MKLAAVWESVRVGLDALRVHPARTLLSTVGVSIGIMALTATFAVIDGVDAMARRIILRETSVQEVVIAPRPPADVNDAERLHDRPTLTLDDMAAARAEISGLAGASLGLSGPTTVAYGSQHRRAQLWLGTASLPTLEGITVLAGRFYTDGEVLHALPVVVLGHRLATELAEPRDPLALLGQLVRVRAESRRVVGVLAPRVDERDLIAFSPLSSRGDIGRLLAGGDQGGVPTLRLKAQNIEAVPLVRAAAIGWIAHRFALARNAFEVTAGLERLERVKQAMFLSKLIFGLLVALMLSVGGIGIMNVMLASVAERTREIGIRKSVGARARDVLVQFLTESLAITGTGAVIGFLAGVPVALGATSVFRSLTGADIYPIFGISTALMVVTAPIIVGTSFGTYPALRAARLPPIEAIARE